MVKIALINLQMSDFGSDLKKRYLQFVVNDLKQAKTQSNYY